MDMKALFLSFPGVQNHKRAIALFLSIAVAVIGKLVLYGVDMPNIITPMVDAMNWAIIALGVIGNVHASKKANSA